MGWWEQRPTQDPGRGGVEERGVYGVCVGRVCVGRVCVGSLRDLVVLLVLLQCERPDDPFCRRGRERPEELLRYQISEAVFFPNRIV